MSKNKEEFKIRRIDLILMTYQFITSSIAYFLIIEIIVNQKQLKLILIGFLFMNFSFYSLISDRIKNDKK